MEYGAIRGSNCWMSSTPEKQRLATRAHPFDREPMVYL
jgi:hypothetical protein